MMNCALKQATQCSRHGTRLLGVVVTQTRQMSGGDGHYDVVVSGGGMVGFAMACALGHSSKLRDQRVMVLEGSADVPWSAPAEFSNRVCALSSRTKALFSSLGAWQALPRAQPVRRMQVWESCSEAMITFDEQLGDDTVAHIVENDAILHALKQALPEHVQVRYGSRVSGYDLPRDTSAPARITLADGTSITANLLIGADGARSLVREAMGAQYLGWEYDQMGIVATLRLSEACDNTVAWQRFLPTGPVALLPLSDDRSSLVWSTTRAEAKRLMQLSEDEFTDALNTAIWADAGINTQVRSIHERFTAALNQVTPAVGAEMRQLPPSVAGVVGGSRGAFPLGLGHAVHYVAPRVALVGDAAHRVHPLAGQGVNLGFGDVQCLTHTLEGAVLRGADVGDTEALYEYESERQKRNVATLAAIDGLHRLYTTAAPPLVLLRSLGLSAVNYLTPVKKFIMKHAES